MSAQRQIPGGPYVNETGSRQAQIPGGPYLNETGGADTTAPVLSSPTGTQTGSSTATVGATTDEGNGTLYAFVSTSATPPSGADLKAGTGAVWSGSTAVSSSGAKTLNATGLSPSTGYYAHLIHTDAAANDSNIVTSSQFTTASASSIAAIAAYHRMLRRA